MKLRGVEQFFLVWNQLLIHQSLTKILLCGKTCNTSKGKSMAPDRKLEKSLKRALRNFHLSLDLYNSMLPDSQETTLNTDAMREIQEVNFE